MDHSFVANPNFHKLNEKESTSTLFVLVPFNLHTGRLELDLRKHWRVWETLEVTGVLTGEQELGHN